MRGSMSSPFGTGPWTKKPSRGCMSKGGHTSLSGPSQPRQSRRRAPIDYACPNAATAPDAHRELAPVALTATRTQLDLTGTWLFLPAERRLGELPASGWTPAAVPGYWAGEAAQRRHTTDRAAPGRLAQCTVGYYRTSFHAAAQWKNRAVLLHLDGVDGWAELYLNGRRLGTLMSWENEDYQLGPCLEYGRETHW